RVTPARLARRVRRVRRATRARRVPPAPRVSRVRPARPAPRVLPVLRVRRAPRVPMARPARRGRRVRRATRAGPGPTAQRACWVTGRADPAVPVQSEERDQQRRLTSLMQSDWRIVYLEYFGDSALPSRMALAYDRLSLRLIVEHWDLAQ